MSVQMMHVRRMRVNVFEPVMLMPMGVRLALRVVRPMLVLVVFVMHVRMNVRRDDMDMLVLVTLHDVEPNP